MIASCCLPEGSEGLRRFKLWGFFHGKLEWSNERMQWEVWAVVDEPDETVGADH